MKPFEIQFLNFQRENGKETDPSSYVFVFDPPKNVERGREQDNLLIYMMFSGNASPDTISPEPLAKDLSNTFYNSLGSLTFALKLVVEKFNTYLVDENMRSTSKGNYRFGCVVLCNLRGNLLYIVQSGPTIVHQLGSEAKTFYDPNLAGKGLGISPTPKMYFSQAKLEEGDTFLVTVEQPKEWEQAVASFRPGTALDNIKRRLLGVTSENVVGLLLNYGDSTQPAVAQPPYQEIGVRDEPLEPGDPTSTDSVKVTSRAGNRSAEIGNHKKRRRTSDSPTISEIAGLVLGVFQKARSFKEKIVRQIESVLFSVVPTGELDQPIQLASKRTGMAIAMILPILVFVIAQVFYSNIGYDAKYSVYIEHAKEDISKANLEANEEVRRVDWQSALSWIEKAELSSSELDAEATGLKEMAQSQLDQINKIIRVKYVPAMSLAIPSPQNIQKMVASDNDLYFLDAVANKVVRASYNGSTYDIDQSFKCGAGAYSNEDGSSTDVSRLVEIIPLVRSTNNSATLMAIDENAHLLYCSPGSEPAVGSLVIPDQGIKQITSVAVFDHALYVLDAVGGTVWYYQGNSDWEFPDGPSFFFSEQIPAALDRSKSIAISGDDLYILYIDGHIAFCQYSRSDLKATRCDDPKLFVETRAGYASGAILGDGVFTQIAITLSPNSTILFLEPNSQSIYNFSPVSVELQNHIRTKNDDANLLPKNQPVQLMAVSPNKTVYLLVGGQVFASSINQ